MSPSYNRLTNPSTLASTMDFPAVKSVTQRRISRKGTRPAARRIDEGGWRLVGTSAQSLHTTSAQGYAVLKRRDYSSLAEVFAERHFLASMLERLRENDPGVFSGSRGKTGIRTGAQLQ